MCRITRQEIRRMIRLKAKIKKWLLLAATVIGVFCSIGVTAFAYVDEAAQQTAETQAPEEPVIPEQPEAPVQEETQTEGTPFSIPGNGQLLDDKADDDTKQFLTVQTKNGNTFFLVLDRSSNTENVYMLSMIDETDLAEFIPETEKLEKEEPAVVLPETEPTPVVEETKPEPESETEHRGSNMGMLLVIALAAAGGIGAYYFKVVKPKKAEAEAGDEDLEFYGDGDYINEDAPEESADQKEEE